MKFEMRNHNSFRNACRFYVAITYLKSKSEEFSLFMQNKKNVKFSVQNQWRVLLNDITDLGSVANSRIPIIDKSLNFENS